MTITTLPAPAPDTRIMKVLPLKNPPLAFPEVVWTREEKLDYVADLIESLPAEHFSLSSWFHFVGPVWDSDSETYVELLHADALPVLMHTCGTTACIAGWIAVDQIHPAFTLKNDSDAEYFSGAWLGLRDFEAHLLFTDPYWWRQNLNNPEVHNLDDVSQEDAVFILRSLADGTLEF